MEGSRGVPELRVAANNSSDHDKLVAEYICDGIADEVEIQAAIDSLPGGQNLMLQQFRTEKWFAEAQSYWTSQLGALEQRLSDANNFVAIVPENAETYSAELARTLTDAGNAFDSTLRAILQGARAPMRKADYDIIDFCRFLRANDPDIHERSVQLRTRFPAGVIVPFSELASPDSVPAWWTAYNKVKHEGSVEYRRGNLANAVLAVSALALVGGRMALRRSSLLCNVGIAYRADSIDMSPERRLLPPV